MPKVPSERYCDSQSCCRLLLPSDTTSEAEKVFLGPYPAVDAAELAAEQEAGLLQQKVGIVAAVGFLQAGLRLLQEKLETQTPA